MKYRLIVALMVSAFAFSCSDNSGRQELTTFENDGHEAVYKAVKRQGITKL